MNYVHGGDVTGYRLQYGREPIDFSASLNPLGMPQAVKKAAALAAENSYSYPDPFSRELTAALAHKLKVRQDHILFGNGAADIIYRLVSGVRPQKALIAIPSFAQYEDALKSVHCSIDYYKLKPEEDFSISRDFMDMIDESTDIVFLCQPNNPTGRMLTHFFLEQLLDCCHKTKTLLVLDESFVPLVPEYKRLSMRSFIADYPQLFILGSFTKLYGMAGIRLGACICSDKEILEKISVTGQPWAVSTVAQAAGLAALNEGDYIKESLELIKAEKTKLINALQSLGMEIIGGAANFIFFRCGNYHLREQLMGKGILIRDCGNFNGLCPGYYRIAVRTEPENKALIDAITEVMPNG